MAISGPRHPNRRPLTMGEEVLNSVTHGIGALLSLASPGLGITVGLGFYLPFSIVLTYSIGTLIRVISDWKLGDSFAESTGIPIAAGVIVGEALVGVGFAVYMILEAV